MAKRKQKIRKDGLSHWGPQGMIPLEERFQKRRNADPRAHGVTGWLSMGIGSDKMQRLKEEIEARLSGDAS